MAGSSSWNLFTDEQLIELYKKEMNDTEIAVELGATRSLVGTRRVRLGLKVIGRRLLVTDEQLIELNEQGLNDKEIAEKLGANKYTVGYHRRRLGLEGRDDSHYGIKRLFTDQQLIELHEQGFNDIEIGKKLGAHPTTVGLHRRRIGLKAHGRKRLYTDEQQLIELNEQGLTDREIAEKLGANKYTVGYHRRRLGLKGHDNPRARAPKIPPRNL